jgi:hypothetical protein
MTRMPVPRTCDSDRGSADAAQVASSKGGMRVIPKMFTILHPPTVVVDASDSQLHQDS